MPRNATGNQQTIDETAVHNTDAFHTRHEPAIKFDELERQFLNAMDGSAARNVEAAEAAAERERRVKAQLDDVVASGVADKMRQLVIESETAMELYSGQEEEHRRRVVETLFGGSLDGIRASTVDKLREKVTTMTAANAGAESMILSLQRQQNAAFDKIEGYLVRMKTLSDDVTRLERERSELEKRQDVAFNRIESYIGKNKALSENVTKHELERTELEKDLEALNGQCELYEADIASLRHGKRDLLDQVSGLDDELQANMGLVDILQAKVDEQAHTVAAYGTQKGVVQKLQDENSVLQTAFDQQKQSMELLRKELEATIVSRDNEHQELQMVIEEHESEKSALQATVDQQKQSMELLQKESEATKATVVSEAGKVQALELLCKELEATIASRGDAHHKLQMVIDEHKSEKSALQAMVDQQKQSMGLLQKESEATKATVVSEAGKVQALENAIIDYKDSIGSLQDELAGVNATVVSKTNELQALERATAEYRVTITTLNKGLDATDAMVVTLQRTTKEQQSNIESAARELSEQRVIMNKDLDTVNATVVTLQRTIEEQRSTLESAARELSEQEIAITTLNKDLETVNATVVSLNDTNNSMQHTISRHNAAIESTAKVTGRLRKERDQAWLEVQSVNSKLANLKGTIASTDEKTRHQFTEYQAFVQIQEELIASRDGEIRELKESMKTIQAENTDLQETVDSFDAAVVDYNANIERTNQYSRSMRDQCAELTATINANKLESDTNEERIRTLTARCAKDAATIESVRAELSEMSEALRMEVEKHDAEGSPRLKHEGDQRVVVDLSADDDEANVNQEFEFLASGKCFGGTTMKPGPRKMISLIEGTWIPAWRSKFKDRGDDDGEFQWASPTLENIASCINRRACRLSARVNGPHDHPINPSSACKRCVERRIPCVMASKSLILPVVLPLPEADRVGFHRGQAGFWIRE